MNVGVAPRGELPTDEDAGVMMLASPVVFEGCEGEVVDDFALD